MIELAPVYDGSTGEIYSFDLKDATVADMGHLAVEVYVYDDSDNYLARYAGVVVSPKTTKRVEVMLRGMATDWGGSGKALVLKPRIYAAVDANGDPAVNLLTNPSFDTDTTPADGVADGWTLTGAKTATWVVAADRAVWPPVIFGNYQRVKHATTSEPDYLVQTGSVSAAAGDYLSFGIWHSTHGATGAGDLDQHAIKLHYDALSDSIFRLRVGSRDWYYHTGRIQATASRTAFTFTVDARGTTQDNYFDDAIVFAGQWLVITPEPRRVEVLPRPRPKNRIAIWGGMDYDHNADGIPDGWVLPSSGTNTYSMEYTPANRIDRGSLKVVLAGASGKTIQTNLPGRFLAGQTWRAKILVKTNGSLGGSPASGDFALRLSTEGFNDGGTLSQVGAWTNFGTLLVSFTEYSADLTLTEDAQTLRLEASLNTVTGTAWFDGGSIERIS